MKKTSRIYIAGHSGMVGSAILRKLKKEGYRNIITFSHNELDLTNRCDTETMFRLYKPSYIFLAAAKVGGIFANNTSPGVFLYENLNIQTNVIEAARKSGAKKLLFLGSSSIYPRECPQPIKENFIMSSPVEQSKSSYAIAKIAGIEMCKSYNKQYGSNFISAIPTNIYGINDNFSFNGSHVLPAMIRKFHEAKVSGIKVVELWGDGTQRREFLNSDDLAEALVLLMQEYNDPLPINIGASQDVPIKFLAKMVSDIIGYKGEIFWNLEYPNGVPQRLLDSSRITNLGWEPTITLDRGVQDTYKWFIENYNIVRKL